MFEEPYFEWLMQQAAAAADQQERSQVERVVARLCNPLLRQAAPFEF